ncbi:alcohol dehydrogenase zinc-binding domain protein [Aspergillus leporis]|uniref:Alcohol dehydrogenase zinc-binding domain protein n=1 Tax=Aspergillus leporis TaxID=41062 RepID=A0A5N5WJE6_9EURO|nr:alcohol dehydrogenase zinc-binding domain protein [Aspergillus leporis]
MRAIVIEKFGGPDSLVGEVVIKVKAFGINHAGMHMRKGEWAEWMPVSGIECVGIVAACPGGEFEGTAVASLMGGLGRTINGSYAEYTRAVAPNVVPLGPAASELEWHQLAAFPETYATAWTCLFRNLDLKKGQKLLIRGATSAREGGHVVATSRNPGRFAHLESLDAERAELEGPNLSERVPGKFDAILELVGNSFLGGLAPVQGFNPLLQMASGVHFSFFGSFVFGTPEFPLSDVSLRVDCENGCRLEIRGGAIAHRVMEANEANGKMVVVVE